MAGLKSGNLITACLCLFIGAAILLAAADIINIPEQDIHAPRWVLGLCGLVFLLGGFMILAGAKSRFNSLGAAILCGSFGLVGAWVALFSPDDSIVGGVPFLSQATNSGIGRWVFGIGSLISFAIAWIAMREFLGRIEPESDLAGD